MEARAGVIDRGKRRVLTVDIDAVDYDAASRRLLNAARERRPYAATALAVHGVVEAHRDRRLRRQINDMDLVTPDGMPVRWALDRLHGTALPDRCYGPTLCLKVLERCAAEGLPVYFYGSRLEVLDQLVENMTERFGGLVVAGSAPSRFASVDDDGLAVIGRQIVETGARIVFVGLGCPRQELFSYALRRHVAMPVLAVGAAFDLHAGLSKTAPGWMQDHGLEWTWRLIHEPRRLWRRYLLLNPYYVVQVLRQWVGRLPSGEESADAPLLPERVPA